MVTNALDYNWEIGFNNALDDAKKISIELNIDPMFPQRLIIQRQK